MYLNALFLYLSHSFIHSLIHGPRVNNILLSCKSGCPVTRYVAQSDIKLILLPQPPEC